MMEHKLATKPGYSIFKVDVYLQDNTYFEVAIIAKDAEEACDIAQRRYPNWQSVGVGYGPGGVD